MANFQTGGAEAAEYEAQQQALAKASRGQRAEFFKLENPGDQAVLRFITDSDKNSPSGGWPRVMQHQSAPTKGAPADYDTSKGSKWPSSMPAVCRYDKGFTNPDGSKDHTDCYICDAKLTNQWGKECKPTQRLWALACVRVPVVEDGVTRGYKDDTIEIPVRDAEGKEIEGQTKTVRHIVVVNFAMKNFFAALQGLAGAYGTVTDRDYIIKRTGEGTATEYQPIPRDPIDAALPDGSGSARFCDAFRSPEGVVYQRHPSWQRYYDAISELGIDLFAIITDRASDDYFARFFDPSKTPPARKSADGSTPAATQQGGGQTQAPTESAAPASNDVSEDRLAEMRNRLRSTPGVTSTEAAPAASPPAQEPVGAGVGAPAATAAQDFG